MSNASFTSLFGILRFFHHKSPSKEMIISLKTMLAFSYRYGIPQHQSLPTEIRVFLPGIDTSNYQRKFSGDYPEDRGEQTR